MSGASITWRQRLAAAMQQHQAGQFLQAVALYQALASEKPDDPDVLHLLGMALDQAGHPAQGKPAIELAIRLSPQVAAYRVTLGNACRAMDDNASAEQAYKEALLLDGAAIEAHNGLGLLAQMRQDWAAARQHFDAALAVDAAYVDARFNRAVTDWRAGHVEAALEAMGGLLASHPVFMPQVLLLAQKTLGDKDIANARRLIGLLTAAGAPEESRLVLAGKLAALEGNASDAEQLYRSVLERSPNNIDALRLLSHLLLEEQNFAAALPLLEHAHQLLPRDVPIFSALGTALMRSGAHERAASVLRQVVAHDPDAIASWGELAMACVKLFRYEEAIAALRRMIELDPDNAASYASLSSYEAQVGNLVAAEDAIARAIALDPDSTITLGNLANLRDLQGQADAAEAIYKQLLERDPEDGTTHTNLALLQLRQGRYAEGWRHYFWRAKGRDWSSPDGSRGLPRWDGEMPLKTGRLLVWGEQGVGDQIVYSSTLAEIARRGVDIVQATDRRLVPLFARSIPGIEVVADDAVFDPAALGITCQYPLADVAALVRVTPQDFAKHPSAYLKADVQRAGAFRTKYAGLGKPLLVGVSWNSHNPRAGRNKSLLLSDMAPLLRDDDVAYVSLQYGKATEDAARLWQETGITVVQDPDVDPLADIDAQAAQIAALDMVVTVSTAAAHIAAGLGIPTLVLLRQDWGQLWYWGEGQATPWYSSVRLCRAARGASAADLVAQAVPALQDMLASLRRSRSR